MKSERTPAKATPPPSTMRQRVAFGTAQGVILPLMAAAAAIIALLYHLDATRPFLERRERLTLDECHRSGRKTPPRNDVLVLAIDDASLKLDAAWPEDIAASPALQAMEKQWPWPRRAWAHILDRLFEAGAKQVFLDITFKSPSEDPENDRLLREALQRYHGKVVLGMKFEDSLVGSGTITELTLPTSAITGPEPDTANTGVLTLWPDADEVVREATWRITASEAEARQSGREVVPNPADAVLPSVSLVLAKNIAPEMSAWPARESRLRFCEPDAYQPVSLFQMFVPGMWEGNLSKGEIFRGKTVLIGATASDLQDFQDTPLGRLAGVQIHAHALTALLEKSFVQQPPGWSLWLFIAAAALAAWLIVSFVRMPLISVLVLVLTGVAADQTARGAFDRMDLEVSALPFTLTLAVCGAAGLTGTFLMQLRESRKLHRFLVRYTSPEFVDEMLSDRAGLYTTLGGVERTVTVLFSDVRGFTSMSENMTPTEIVTQLNEYLSRMVERVFKHRGLVDKFIGDAVMALWGSTRFKPSTESCREDAQNAVTAALAMRTALEELNADWRARGIPELKIGVGIHQGDVVVGNIGSEAPYEKMDLTVIGDAVNLASRLEGVTKEYGVDLIISDAVQRHVHETFICRSADLVAVKGKARPVEVFTVLSAVGTTVPAGLETFEIGIRLYREGRFSEALGAFNQAAAEGLDDKLTHVYQERCGELIASPPEKWNGVFVMTKK